MWQKGGVLKWVPGSKEDGAGVYPVRKPGKKSRTGLGAHFALEAWGMRKQTHEMKHSIQGMRLKTGTLLSWMMIKPEDLLTEL